MMVLMMILHVFRVYLTGGFKKPRELTWVTVVVLGVLTASFGVTGYSLPRDQIGYWAVKIVTGVPEAIPVIGSPLVELLRGSASVGQSTLTRFYCLHTFVLPLLIREASKWSPELAAAYEVWMAIKFEFDAVDKLDKPAS
ncbi:hypothetical protein ES288_A09G128100v1 [Gossypium darwinii]|uniref:Cytochrome b/b6 N-terminal region profile domain-containing protein n=1 Tax=Gossypium darwinii TaxID=34276 RepID=A0A5D2FA52_GOSDA|nr:hypothetical protein ES288_A09G128100v1 [Gossypium darwinii]